MLTRTPPHGISCWTINDSINRLEAVIQGPSGTPYEGGSFHLDVTVPERYPFEPPQIKFITKVYHPNVDNSTGLICMDQLKMPPAGNWRPAINLPSLLISIQILLGEANPNDPLDADIAKEYMTNRSLFDETAKTWTREHAVANKTNGQKRKSDETCDKAKRPKLSAAEANPIPLEQL